MGARHSVMPSSRDSVLHFGTDTMAENREERSRRLTIAAFTAILVNYRNLPVVVSSVSLQQHQLRRDRLSLLVGGCSEIQSD